MPVVSACVDVLAVMVRLQFGPWPAQAPVQPANLSFRSRTSVRMTVEPCRYVAEQVPLPPALQLMLPTEEMIWVPPHSEALVTETESVYVLSVNVAVTEVAEVIVTVHVPVPLQPPPLQPAKVESAAGDAVSVIVVP